MKKILYKFKKNIQQNKTLTDIKKTLRLGPPYCYWGHASTLERILCLHTKYICITTMTADTENQWQEER